MTIETVYRFRQDEDIVVFRHNSSDFLLKTECGSMVELGDHSQALRFAEELADAVKKIAEVIR